MKLHVNKKIFAVQSQHDVKRCFPIMQELRPHLNMEEYLDIYHQAKKSDGYVLVAIEENGEILALMGYRFLADFVRGKHLYIDDLVSTERARSKGLGAELLKFAEDIAAKNGCKSLRLCTGIENERGIKFYDRNGWSKRAFAYVKKITPQSSS